MWRGAPRLEDVAQVFLDRPLGYDEDSLGAVVWACSGIWSIESPSRR
jgi:hypothetical protein